jgi:hypothetical protein
MSPHPRVISHRLTAALSVFNLYAIHYYLFITCKTDDSHTLLLLTTYFLMFEIC